MFSIVRSLSLLCFLILGAFLFTIAPAGKAWAGGGDNKQCGVTIPGGSYKNHCKDIEWDDPWGDKNSAVLMMRCSVDGKNYSSRTLACSQVKECGWKLAFINYYPRCD